MKTIKNIVPVLTLLLLFQVTFCQTEKAACCATKVKACESEKKFSLGDMKDIPNVKLINQNGENVNFYDLIKGKVVALNFIFTSCKTICPPMGANFSSLKKKMAKRIDSSELVMLTISIDPLTDTPERLKAWSEQFEAGPGWTLLTGTNRDINSLLKKLEVYTALKEEHAPIILLGKEGTNKWIRTNGLTNSQELANTLENFFDEEVTLTKKKVIKKENSDKKYFTNVVLINQFGENKRLYKDLLKDKIVIINPFFSECTGVCPVMNLNLEKIQEHLGDKLGNEVHILSLTVDHKTDTQEILNEYAKKYHAKKGWHFLTGEKDNIEFALQKLGKSVANREAHDAIFLVGNLNTKLWKKVNGLANIDDIIAQIDSVLNDGAN
ncbi:MAG: hypothetical protein COA88_15530 [Kordia sp.]|nr:MAG: hypothetical protein COA88_15530 [Kordia sp.]